MKQAIALYCLLLLVFPAGAQTKAALIRRLDQHNAAVLLQNDTAALQKYLAPDFLLNTSGNTVSFGSHRIVALLRSGRVQYTRLDVVTDTVYFPHKRTALSMGSETAVFGSEGPLKGVVQKRRYTNMWVKEGRTWKLKARHSSIVCDLKLQAGTISQLANLTISEWARHYHIKKAQCFPLLSHCQIG